MNARSSAIRLAALTGAFMLLISSVLVAAPSSVAFAKVGCNSGPHANEADIGVSQSISGPLANLHYLVNVTVTNYGPCNVPGTHLVVTLGAGDEFVASPLFSSNPNSWTCGTGGGQTVSCDETATIGVPGTADVSLEFILNPCDTSSATPAQCATFIAVGSATPPDPDCVLVNLVKTCSGNNTSYAGLLVADGAAIIFGPNGDPTPTSNFKHTTSVNLISGGGGSVNIYQSPTCPPDHTNCFIGTVTISTSATGPKTRTLEFLASLTGSPARPLSQVTILYEAAGDTQFSALTSCSKNNPPTSENACVQDSYKFTSPDGVVYVFVIQGGKDDSFTAD